MPGILWVFVWGLFGGLPGATFATSGSRVEPCWPISGLQATKWTCLRPAQLPVWLWRAADLESAITGVPPDQFLLALTADRGGGGPTGGGQPPVFSAASVRSVAQAVPAG